jgi:preprotein translocase subunit SecD
MVRHIHKKAGLSGLFRYCLPVVTLFISTLFAAAEPLTLAVSDVQVVERSGEPLLAITLTVDAGQRFAQFTQENVGRFIEIRGGGHTNKPILRTPIEGGKLQMIDFSSVEQAKQVAARIAADRKIEVEVPRV